MSSRPHISVTNRQLEVLAAHVATGTAKGAAHRLGISLSTVNGHLTALRERLHVETSEQAVSILAESGRLHVPELAGRSAAPRPVSLPLRAWGLVGARTPV